MEPISPDKVWPEASEPGFVRQISRRRFDALASYARQHRPGLFTEYGWWESTDRRVVATLAHEAVDGEFIGVVMARDALERFRFVSGTSFHRYWKNAVAELYDLIAITTSYYDQMRIQGDEKGKPVDFFEPTARTKRVDQAFRALTTHDGYVAARRIIAEMMRWYEDVDGNFIEQFRSDGFNSRLWELYLWAMLVEQSLYVERPSPAPDFLAHGVTGWFAIEATSINPSQGSTTHGPTKPDPDADEDVWLDYRRNYLPIRYAGPLIAKLKRRYWEGLEVDGMPFTFAIQDFHDGRSMTYSQSALWMFLYGFEVDVRHEENGQPTVTSVRIDEHVWGSKKVKSGFFSYPDAENVSAVLFNATATISKFNRMGVSAGFGAEDWTLVHQALIADPNPKATKPRTASYVVKEGDSESWTDGLNVFHNPNATYPLDTALLPDATHHTLLPSGELQSVGMKPPLISSNTLIMPAAALAELRRRGVFQP